MYSVHVRDLPCLVVNARRKGQVKNKKGAKENTLSLFYNMHLQILW